MSSRVHDGRSLARRAKQILALVAATAFATTVGLARASHPGEVSSGVAGNSGANTEQESETFDFGSASLEPSFGAAPEATSRVS